MRFAGLSLIDHYCVDVGVHDSDLYRVALLMKCR